MAHVEVVTLVAVHIDNRIADECNGAQEVVSSSSHGSSSSQVVNASSSRMFHDSSKGNSV